MKVCTCLLLFTIFAQADLLENNGTRIKETKLNSSIENALELNNKDKTSDIKLVYNIQNILKRVKNVIDSKQNTRRFSRTVVPVNTLTDFIQQVIGTVINYHDKEFQDFLDILDKEVRKYHYRGCKFHEITENYELRNLIAAKLSLIRDKPVDVIRKNMILIKNILEDEKYDSNVKDLVDYINSLYRKDGRDKFEKILVKLKKFDALIYTRGQDTSLAKVVKDAVRSIIFDHYTNLNRNAKRELKEKIESFLLKYKLSNHFSKIKNDKSSANHVPVTNNDRTDAAGSTESHRKFPTYFYYDQNEEMDPLDYNKIKVTTGSDSNTEILDKFVSIEDSTVENFPENSIQADLERQLKQNTERYLTLYTEDITYKPTTTEKPERVFNRAAQATRSKYLHYWKKTSTQTTKSTYKPKRTKPRAIKKSNLRNTEKKSKRHHRKTIHKTLDKKPPKSKTKEEHKHSRSGTTHTAGTMAHDTDGSRTLSRRRPVGMLEPVSTEIIHHFAAVPQPNKKDPNKLKGVLRPKKKSEEKLKFKVYPEVEEEAKRESIHLRALEMETASVESPLFPLRTLFPKSSNQIKKNTPTWPNAAFFQQLSEDNKYLIKNRRLMSNDTDIENVIERLSKLENACKEINLQINAGQKPSINTTEVFNNVKDLVEETMSKYGSEVNKKNNKTGVKELKMTSKKVEQAKSIDQDEYLKSKEVNVISEHDDNNDKHTPTDGQTNVKLTTKYKTYLNTTETKAVAVENTSKITKIRQALITSKSNTTASNDVEIETNFMNTLTDHAKTETKSVKPKQQAFIFMDGVATDINVLLENPPGAKG